MAHFIRVDGGTETGVMAVTHAHLRARHGSPILDGVEFNPEDTVLFGPSTQNKIERWYLSIKIIFAMRAVGRPISWTYETISLRSLPFSGLTFRGVDPISSI